MENQVELWQLIIHPKYCWADPSIGQLKDGHTSGKCGDSDFTKLIWPHGSRQGCLDQGITKIIWRYHNGKYMIIALKKDIRFILIIPILLPLASGCISGKYMRVALKKDIRFIWNWHTQNIELRKYIYKRILQWSNSIIKWNHQLFKVRSMMLLLSSWVRSITSMQLWDPKTCSVITSLCQHWIKRQVNCFTKMPVHALLLSWNKIFMACTSIACSLWMERDAYWTLKLNACPWVLGQSGGQILVTGLQDLQWDNE